VCVCLCLCLCLCVQAMLHICVLISFFVSWPYHRLDCWRSASGTIPQVVRNDLLPQASQGDTTGALRKFHFSFLRSLRSWKMWKIGEMWKLSDDSNYVSTFDVFWRQFWIVLMVDSVSLHRREPSCRSAPALVKRRMDRASRQAASPGSCSVGSAGYEKSPVVKID
jgi:hypothetical protein